MASHIRPSRQQPVLGRNRTTWVKEERGGGNPPGRLSDVVLSLVYGYTPFPSSSVLWSPEDSNQILDPRALVNPAVLILHGVCVCVHACVCVCLRGRD